MTRTGVAANVFAFAIYFICAFLFVGRGLIGHWSTAHIGDGADPQLMMWFLVWWPYALIHHLNIFLSKVIWAPTGYNLTWQTSVPLVSLMAAPLTATLGPIATLNILCLSSLALAAWCVFFLCRYLSGNYWSAIVGGYIFGFSPYMLGQLYFTHLHTLFIFPVPLAIYFGIRRFRDEITARQLTVALAILLVAQFFIALEIFATMIMFGAMALGLAFMLSAGDTRRCVLGVLGCLGLSCAAALLIATPFLYYFFAYRLQDGPIWSVTILSADLLNFFIPSPNNQLGHIPLLNFISAPFNGRDAAEPGAYFALPLLAIVIAYARRYWHSFSGRLLIDSFIIILLLSLGPAMVVAGRATHIGMPDAVLQLPILDSAAPVRFCLYAFLIVAIIYALWSSSTTVSAYFRFGVALAIVALTFPAISASYWVKPQPNPRFFGTSEYKHYLKRGETVLFLPFWPYNDSMLWQAETGMYFRMAQGAGPWFGRWQFWPIIDPFMTLTYVPAAQAQFEAYLADHDVRAVIVVNKDLAMWRPFLAPLDADPVRRGGISLYRVPARLRAGPTMKLLEARSRFDSSRFQNLLVDTEILLAEEGQLSRLSVANAVTAGVLPTKKLIGPSMVYPVTRCSDARCSPSPFARLGLLLMPLDHKHVAVGIQAWYPSAKLLLQKYGPLAHESAFVIPPWRKAKSQSEYIGSLVMIFDRAQLAKAARTAMITLDKNGLGDYPGAPAKPSCRD
ncbi:MAG: hypothetical protein ACREQX_04220 [Candidatus Binataceae bacterium]